MWDTKRRLCSMSFMRALSSPALMTAMAAFSSSRDSGLGKLLRRDTMPKKNSASRKSQYKKRKHAVPSPSQYMREAEKTACFFLNVPLLANQADVLSQEGNSLPRAGIKQAGGNPLGIAILQFWAGQVGGDGGAKARPQTGVE